VQYKFSSPSNDKGRIVVFSIPFTDFGIKLFMGPSKELVRVLMADCLDGGFDESGAPDFGKSCLITGGGVERFLVLGFSKADVNVVKAGDFPQTQGRSGLVDMLLVRCDLSAPVLLPENAIIRRLGFCRHEGCQ
jgi:hypothetical protein